jgi:acyl-CoA synthetase (AMP-forming)/AMP-acid ligase II
MVTTATAGLIHSPFPALDIPAVSLPAHVREAARRHGERLALVDGPSGRSYTYVEFERLIGRCAAGLSRIGFKPGEVLLIFAPNCPEWAIVALGAMAAGGVVSGANAGYSAAELARQVQLSGARYALTIAPFLDTLREAAAGTACTGLLCLGPAAGAIDVFELLRGDDPEPAVTIAPGSLAALPCSSGTSGLPKAVMLTHANLVANVVQLDSVFESRDDVVSLAFLPLFHIFGFTVVLLGGLVAGRTIVTVPRFEPESFLGTIARHRVTELFVVPPIMQFLAAHPLVDAYDLKSIEFIGCGAAPMGCELADKVAARLGCTVGQGYGMTESSGVISCAPRRRQRSGACGLLMPGTVARLIDPETGRDAAPGEPGELWLSGPQFFQGYRDDAAATAATIDGERWMRTGDIARFDSDGYLYLTDRLKELIKVNGYQVAPAELEALLLGSPMVADAAVIGRPDERAGERPVAYVVFRGAPDPEGLRQWVAERVAEYKQLGAVVPCEQIPKSPSGKILRRLLRERER